MRRWWRPPPEGLTSERRPQGERFPRTRRTNGPAMGSHHHGQPGRRPGRRGNGPNGRGRRTGGHLASTARRGVQPPMEFRVLGPIEAIEDGRRLAVASGRQLSLLAFLLIHANRIVSADRIIDELWGDEPPENGAKTVAFHVSRLRDALEPGRERGRPSGAIATEPAGYALRVEPEQIDAVRLIGLPRRGGRSLPTIPRPPARASWRPSICVAANRMPTSPTNSSPSPRSGAWRSCACGRPRTGWKPTSRWAVTRT